jgi:hypothetical protein
MLLLIVVAHLQGEYREGKIPDFRFSLLANHRELGAAPRNLKSSI